MPRSLTSFRGALTGSGTRPNLFQVNLAFPPFAALGKANTMIPMMATTASLPTDKVGEIEIPYMGRKTYYPGDREFDPWTVSFINDEDFGIHDSFELWLSAFNSHVGNIRSSNAATPSQYTVNAEVSQFSKLDLPPIKVYAMIQCFPTSVGAIELDWGTNNTVEKFDVTFRYQWWGAIGPNGFTSDEQTLTINP